MLRASAIVLTIWSGISFLLSFIILTSVVIFRKNAPILIMEFDKAEVPKLDVRVISVVNSLATLYNSCAMSFSLIALLTVWSGLINGQPVAFWFLLFTIGLVQIMGFIAFSVIRNKRMPVNIMLTVLYAVGIAMAGYSIFVL